MDSDNAAAIVSDFLNKCRNGDAQEMAALMESSPEVLERFISIWPNLLSSIPPNCTQAYKLLFDCSVEIDPYAYFSRKRIWQIFGGQRVGYLIKPNGRYVAGCFHLEMDPHAPNEVYVGISPDVIKCAKQISDYTGGIHAFVCEKGELFKYLGIWKCVCFDTSVDGINAALQVLESARLPTRKLTGVLRFARTIKNG